MNANSMDSGMPSESALEEEYLGILSAVEKGEKDKKSRLAWFMLSGRGGANADANQAVQILEEQVKCKDAEAMWMLGLCKEYGIGTEEDINAVDELYEQSSKGGSIAGKLFHCMRYENMRGSGVMRLRRL